MRSSLDIFFVGELTQHGVHRLSRNHAVPSELCTVAARTELETRQRRHLAERQLDTARFQRGIDLAAKADVDAAKEQPYDFERVSDCQRGSSIPSKMKVE